MSRFEHQRRGVRALIAASCLCAMSCDRDPGIAERRAPKGVEIIVGPEVGASGPAAGRAPAHTHDHAARWTLPDGWREVATGSPARLAVFEFDDESGVVSVVLTRFPGDVGGVLANVNRWRTQLGLAPVAEGDLPGIVERFEPLGFRAYAVTLVNEDRATVAVGLEEPARSRTWFVKADVHSEATERVRARVLAFARSFVASDPVGER